MAIERLGTTNGRVHGFGDDALGEHDGAALVGLLRRRQVSARELAEAAIARWELVNPVLNATVLTTFDRALAEADRVDHELRAPSSRTSLPYFAGLPGFVKDNTNVAGLPTRHGSYAAPTTPAAKDDPNARQYLGQGFGLLGKTTLPEFGLSCSTEFRPDPATGEPTPPTRNPWDPARTAGGSSGGSAALVAAGVVPVAHANDGGGSIRIPAACCGLVGLKPSRGRMLFSSTSASAPVKVVADGVVTRTVRDTARYLAEAERWLPARRRSRTLGLIGLVEGPGTARLRIGVIHDSLPGIAPADRQTRAAVARTAELLAGLGHHVEEAALPIGPWFKDDFLSYWKFLAWSVTTLYPRLHGYGKDAFDELLYSLADAFRRDKRKTLLAYLRLQALSTAHRLPPRASAHDAYDVLLSPALNHITPELGWLSPTVPYPTLIDRLVAFASYTPLANAAGTPAVSVPVGLAKEGVPLAAMLSSDYGQDRALVELAYEIEAAQPFPAITG